MIAMCVAGHRDHRFSDQVSKLRAQIAHANTHAEIEYQIAVVSLHDPDIGTIKRNDMRLIQLSDAAIATLADEPPFGCRQHRRRQLLSSARTLMRDLTVHHGHIDLRIFPVHLVRFTLGRQHHDIRRHARDQHSEAVLAFCSVGSA